MLFGPNKDLVLPSSSLHRPAAEEEHVIQLVGARGNGERLPSRVRRMVVSREGELHRLDCTDVCRRILDDLKGGMSVAHAVEKETRGMSQDQLQLVRDTLEGAIFCAHMSR